MYMAISFKGTRSCNMSILISFGWGESEARLQEQRVAEVCLVKVAQFHDRFEGKDIMIEAVIFGNKVA